jgi:copper chaperone CopZ
MACQLCVDHLEEVLAGMKAVKGQAINRKAGAVKVQFDPAQISSKEIAAALEETGFKARPQ